MGTLLRGPVTVLWVLKGATVHNSPAYSFRRCRGVVVSSSYNSVTFDPRASRRRYATSVTGRGAPGSGGVGEKDDGLWQGTTGHSSSRDHSNHNHNHRWTTGSILRWSPIPILSALVYASYKRLQEVEDEIKTNGVKELEVTAYRLLPWRTISRAWGWANSIPLPVWARKPFLSWYVNAFGCEVCEAEDEDLSHYANLGEFFRRRLKEGIRPVCPVSPMVSPVDGKILNAGRIDVGSGRVEQVKGASYSLETFLGPSTSSSSSCFPKCLLKSPDVNCLYQVVIYLAPGDYHRFHSPAEWNVSLRRHFPGELLSVNPRIAGWIGGLFALNERAAYLGSWKHGFFSMTAVGATNVGSIKVYSDPELVTNRWAKGNGRMKELKFKKDVPLCKGEDFGEFNLGSTIVLLFEAPKDNFVLDAKVGAKVRVGQPLLVAV